MFKNRNVLAHRNEKGQSFVELALSLIFLLTLLSVVIDLGWAFFTLIALRDAAQEAAAVGAVCPTLEADADSSPIRARLRDAATAPIDMSKLEDSRIDIVILDVDTGASIDEDFEVGDSVSVTITYTHDIMVPMVGSFIGTQTYDLKATAVDTILSTTCRIKSP